MIKLTYEQKQYEYKNVGCQPYDMKTVMELKEDAYELCRQEYDRLIAQVGQYTLEYETIEETNKQLIKDNKKDIKKWKENITELETKIQEIDDELASLTAE